MSEVLLSQLSSNHLTRALAPRDCVQLWASSWQRRRQRCCSHHASAARTRWRCSLGCTDQITFTSANAPSSCITQLALPPISRRGYFLLVASRMHSRPAAGRASAHSFGSESVFFLTMHILSTAPSSSSTNVTTVASPTHHHDRNSHHHASTSPPHNHPPKQ